MRNYFILTAAIFICHCYTFRVYAQSIDPFYQSIVNNVSYDSILLNLQEFEALGVKEVGDSELNDTRNWILNKYADLGYTNVQVDTFNAWGNELYNIIITKTGTLYPNTFVILDGHYDTNTGTGTNDNGSGTSIILETARVLKNINTEYSIKFIHFSGEELGMTGSDHYVSNIVNPENMDIRIVFNIDEVGGVAGLPNDTMKCESDQSNPSSNDAISDAFTDTLMTLTEMYSSLKTIKTNAYGSDYVPFQQNGEIITGYYENTHSDFVHSADDFLSHLDTSYVYETSKAAAASTMYFAKAYDVSVNINESNNNFIRFNLYPNPFHSRIYIQAPETGKQYCFILLDCKGQLIYRNKFRGNASIDFPELAPSIYLYQINNSKEEVVIRGKLSSF